MSSMSVLKDKCNNCGICTDVCLYDAIKLSQAIIVVDFEKCILCGACWNNCPNHAIVKLSDDKAAKTYPLSAYLDICIYVEHSHGIMNPSVREVIHIARELKEQAGCKLKAVLAGSKAEDIANEITSYGVDEVWMVNNPNIHDYAEDLQCQVISDMIARMKPSILLASGTKYGRSLMPRVASLLNTGLCADCIKLRYDESNVNLIMIRPAYSGKVIAEITIPEHRPQMATVKMGIFPMANKKEGCNGRIIDISSEITLGESDYKVLDILSNINNLVNLSHSEVVVAFGRGIKSTNNIPLINDFAKTLGGCVGATRAVVDAGWIDHSHQIGQTGKVIRPKIYIACGISGAIQHIIGMKDSGLIIAINSDRNAPIVDIADYAIIGDLFQIIPELIKELSKNK